MLPDRSVRMILIGKGLRSFADGYVAVLLPAYLLALGFNQFEVGLLGTLTLAIGFMPQPLILFSQTAAAALLEPAAYLSAVLPSASIQGARP